MVDRRRLRRKVYARLRGIPERFKVVVELLSSDKLSYLDQSRVARLLKQPTKFIRSVTAVFVASDLYTLYNIRRRTCKLGIRSYQIFLKRHARRNYLKGRTGFIKLADRLVLPC